MSFESLKQAAAALDDAARKQLVSFLISLREEKWATQVRAMAGSLDDSSSDRWLTLEEFSRRLDRIPEPKEE